VPILGILPPGSRGAIAGVYEPFIIIDDNKHVIEAILLSFVAFRSENHAIRRVLLRDERSRKMLRACPTYFKISAVTLLFSPSEAEITMVPFDTTNASFQVGESFFLSSTPCISATKEESIRVGEGL